MKAIEVYTKFKAYGYSEEYIDAKMLSMWFSVNEIKEVAREFNRQVSK